MSSSSVQTQALSAPLRPKSWFAPQLTSSTIAEALTAPPPASVTQTKLLPFQSSLPVVSLQLTRLAKPPAVALVLTGNWSSAVGAMAFGSAPSVCISTYFEVVGAPPAPPVWQSKALSARLRITKSPPRQPASSTIVERFPPPPVPGPPPPPVSPPWPRASEAMKSRPSRRGQRFHMLRSS